MTMENPVSVTFPLKEETMQIRYYLRCCPCNADTARKAYGVTAELLRGEEVVDEETVDDISCDREGVLALIAKLARCSVTPVTLRDVVEDSIA